MSRLNWIVSRLNWIVATTFAYLIFDIVVWSQQPPWLETYGSVASVVTHLWALPAITYTWKKYPEIFGSLVVTTLVSMIYHICDITTDDQDIINSFQRADHGFTVSLVALIVLHRLYNIWYMPVYVFGVLSSSFSFMNLITTGFISLFAFFLFLPKRKKYFKNIKKEGFEWIRNAIIVQTIGIVFFFVDIPPFSQSFHAWWHITSFLGIYFIIRSLEFNEVLDTKEDPRGPRLPAYKRVLTF